MTDAAVEYAGFRNPDWGLILSRLAEESIALLAEIGRDAVDFLIQFLQETDFGSWSPIVVGLGVPALQELLEMLPQEEESVE